LELLLLLLAISSSCPVCNLTSLRVGNQRVGISAGCFVQLPTKQHPHVAKSGSIRIFHQPNPNVTLILNLTLMLNPKLNTNPKPYP